MEKCSRYTIKDRKPNTLGKWEYLTKLRLEPSLGCKESDIHTYHNFKLQTEVPRFIQRSMNWTHNVNDINRKVIQV